MTVECPQCAVKIILVLLEFRQGELVTCKFTCPQCDAKLTLDNDFFARIDKSEPKLLTDAEPDAGESGAESHSPVPNSSC